MARILIVDDVTPIREIVAAILQKRGHRVFACKSAEEALIFAVDKRVHLVLTDVNMPGIDGINMIKRMRSLPLYEAVPFVILAKGAKDESIELARANGAVDWIAKPFTEEVLVNKVNQILVDHYVN